MDVPVGLVFVLETRIPQYILVLDACDYYLVMFDDFYMEFNENSEAVIITHFPMDTSNLVMSSSK